MTRISAMNHELYFSYSYSSFFSSTSTHSKAALKISSNPQLPPTASNAFATQKLKYAGDILLQFIHTPTCEKKSMKTRRRREREMARERRGSGRESSMDGSGEVKEDIDRGPQQDSDSTMATRMLVTCVLWLPVVSQIFHFSPPSFSTFPSLYF